MWGRPLSVLVASFAVGLLQLGLAYAAGVHADLHQGDVHRFGYLRTLHWSLLYTLVIPIILAASVPVTLTLYRRSKAGPAYRLRFYILVLGALAFAAGMAGHEGWRAWAPLSGHQEFFQWNSFNADARVPYTYAAPFARASHVALFWVAYAHYFAACFFGLVAAFGVPWYFAVIARFDHSVIQLRDVEYGLLSSLRIAVVGYLVYFAVLRSSKISMHLEATGMSVDLDGIAEPLKALKPYLDFIARDLFLNVVLGLFFVGLAIWAHLHAWRMSTPPQQTGFIQDLFRPVAGAYELLGPAVRFWVGVCLIAIVLPPPGFQYLVALGGVLGGLYLVKSSHSR